MRLALWAGLLAGTLPQGVAAQTLSGNILYESCTSENTVQEAFCVGYLIGQLEGQVMGGVLIALGAGIELTADEFASFTNQMFQHCVPSDATNEQLRDVVVAYLRDNPETRHHAARSLAWSAYREAFPCSE